MVWVIFIGASVIIVLAAMKLAEYGDVIALRTGLGGMFIGTLLLAGATSLPELLTGVSSVNQGIPELAVGNYFGSNMFNMLMLAIIDVMNFRHRVLRKIAVSHALTAAFAILLAVCAVFFIQGKLDFGIGWFGADSLILIGLYIFGAQVIHEYNSRLSPTAPPKPEDFNDNLPTLRRALIGFGAATAVLIIITPIMVSSANDIAELTGISAGFIGVALVSVITSLPELVTTIAAARIGAFDLAVGNLFGSNVFNVMALGLTDAFYTKGFLLTDLNPDLAISGMFGIILTTMALVGNLAHVQRRIWIIEVEAFTIMVVYALGLFMLYERGLMG